MTKTGRPTKYRDSMPQRVLDYIDDCKNNHEMPFVEEVAIRLGVNTDTTAEWQHKYPMFSDAIKRLKAVQSLGMQKGGMTNKYNPTMCIFLLKNNHNMTDRHDVTSKGDKLEGPVVYMPNKHEE